MFPPISSNGVFEDPSIFFEEDKFLEELLVDFPVSENINALDDVKTTKNNKRARKISASREIEEKNDDSKKKAAHKLIEKQRRKEMSGVYASLRSLLPLEYIKGKRAVSDHMSEAVHYIDDLKNKIQELKARRDGLSNGNVASSVIESENQILMNTGCVKINLFKDGLEILISSSSSSSLSTVLADLSERHLNVINCVTTRGIRSYLHKIQIQAFIYPTCKKDC